MKLGAKQELFARLYPRLILKAFELGYEVRLGDVFRDPRVFGAIGEKKGYGHKNSCHKYKLAGDLNLFKVIYPTGGRKYITDDEGHKELGEWWEQQNELCRWGGRFNDPNHYSLEHNGSK